MGGEGKLLVSLHRHHHSANKEGLQGLKLSRLNVAALRINLAPFDVVFLVCIQPGGGFLGKKPSVYWLSIQHYFLSPSLVTKDRDTFYFHSGFMEFWQPLPSATACVHVVFVATRTL